MLTRPSPGVEFSFVGEPVNRDIASSKAASRGSESARGLIVGVFDCERVFDCAVDIRDVVGVVEGEDLVGEMDLARSGL